MTLADLLRELAELEPGLVAGAPPAGPAAAAEVTGVTWDSREVLPGVVFVALRGARADGGAFARDAAGRGAIAVVSDGPRPAISTPRGST